MHAGSWRRKRKFDGSMGGTSATATAAANVLGRQINAHLRNASRARAHVRTYMRVCTRTQLWQLPTATGVVTCVLLYQPLTPFGRALVSLATAATTTLASPLPRAVIQSSASYDLYVVIPSVWSSGRLGFSLRALPFVSIWLACTRAYTHAGNCERYARFVSVIADWWLAKPLTEWFDCTCVGKYEKL